MTSLSFRLNPDAMVKFHDAFACLAKFSDTIALEAEHDLLRIKALNTTKTAFASLVFDREDFFEEYDFSALLSVFRGKVDKGKETAIEVCYVELFEDDEQDECRLNIRMICAMGVIKSYKLTYEPGAIQHAIFDQTKATNRWSVNPRYLKQIIDHFSVSAEQLDLYGDEDQAVFTSFTTKIMEGDEVLKNPIHTSVATTKSDFYEFSVEDKMHITITLKDFKAVVLHAESGGSTITARYTRPCRPIQLAYEITGIKADFILMTRGEAEDVDGSSSSRAKARAAAAEAPRRKTVYKSSVARSAANRVGSFFDIEHRAKMPPPPVRARPLRPLHGSSTLDHLSRNSASEILSASSVSEVPEVSEAPEVPEPMEFDSLFVTQDNDQWDELVTNEEPQDILGWDATGQEPLERILRDAEPDFPKPVRLNRLNRTAEDEMGIPPTQRMSQVRGMGLFD
ncbi:Rad9/DDC1 [Penicillium verhagenii]|uniref:Rad9/DDC1 n=1 Tax=Penicillium verhagenii TaxID=1562060 RepID=UPI00254553B2|nr:Rad9/DDC1 [Penicillium verhagenii]KAJ5938532.1 Rad9/DDC1 [Penicillium verhagenii]